ncbi:MAG: signal peptidase I [Clostridia bacterium]|jgi:signal peptidase I|nr:signal peptidase I [Spirochaetia bacterium]
MRHLESFAEARRRRVRSFRLLRQLGIFFVFYLLMTAYGFKPLIAVSSSMAPTIQPGDRLLSVPAAFGIANPLDGTRISYLSPQRGDIVLVSPPWVNPTSLYHKLANSVIRFFTAQRVGIKIDPLDRPVIKRIVALPGDTVQMDEFIVYVRTADSGHFLTEYEVSGRSYDLRKSGLPEGWEIDMPLSGRMDPVILGPGEYFVIGDNRPGSTDSRFFGPVDIDHVLGKIVLRYWPWKLPVRL